MFALMRYSAAPIRIPFSTSSCWPRLEITATGMVRHAAFRFISSRNENPSIPGSTMSSSTASMPPVSSARRASPASTALTTRYPSSRNLRSRRPTRRKSSSTMRIVRPAQPFASEGLGVLTPTPAGASVLPSARKMFSTRMSTSCGSKLTLMRASLTPICRARSSSIGWPELERMRTGVAGSKPSSFIFSKILNPESPGNNISSSTRSGRVSLMSANPETPSAAVATSYPAAMSRPRSNSKITSSSSISNIFFLLCAPSFRFAMTLSFYSTRRPAPMPRSVDNWLLSRRPGSPLTRCGLDKLSSLGGAQTHAFALGVRGRMAEPPSPFLLASVIYDQPSTVRVRAGRLVWRLNFFAPR